jgi:Zn finger protein HypA/HybF involved in hydrogenase expression
MVEENAMYECPLCQGRMEEITVDVTECCGAEVNEDDEESICPICGAENPIVVEGEPTLRCENCGHSE